MLGLPTEFKLSFILTDDAKIVNTKSSVRAKLENFLKGKEANITVYLTPRQIEVFFHVSPQISNNTNPTFTHSYSAFFLFSISFFHNLPAKCEKSLGRKVRSCPQT